MQKRLAEHTKHRTINDRDAVVWSLDTNNYYALVKIQGSDTTIKAHFPRNWKTIPHWLKPGNAVRIRHRSGEQGFTEVIGHGRAVPTPVEGGSLLRPPVPGDCVLTGMVIMAHPNGGMNIYVSSGTYRINGIAYSYAPGVTGYIVMDDPAPMTMGLGIVMGYGGTITPIAITAAPSGMQGRYDAICVGADGVVDVIDGIPASLTLEPYKPSIPQDHVLIGYLFIYSGMTDIEQEQVGVVWTLPYPLEVEVTATDLFQWEGGLHMGWDTEDDTPVAGITWAVKDQYGWTFPLGIDSTLIWHGGTGGVGTSVSGPFNSSASIVWGGNVTYFYQRNQLADPEKIGVLYLTTERYSSVVYSMPIILLDFLGIPVGSPT